MNNEQPTPSDDLKDHIHLEAPASPVTWDYMPDPEVAEVLVETATETATNDAAASALELHNSETPILSGGDIDADWGRANDVGEEAVGGTVKTPDQDRVDELGQAWGIEYQDNEPLKTQEKLDERDRNRWELNPASQEPEDKG